MAIKRRCNYFFGAIVAIGVIISGGFLFNRIVKAESAEKAGSSTRLVSIHDRDSEKTIVTNALTVRQALQAAGIAVDEKRDVIEPNIDMELTGTKFQVNIHRARMVTVIDGTKSRQVITAEQSPIRIAKKAGIILYREDKIDFSNPENLLVSGASLAMKIERAKRRTITEDVEVAFPVEQTKDDTQPIGFKQIKQLGEKGIKKVTYKVEANNGIEVSRREVSHEIIKQPKKQIEVVGTKPKNPLTKGKGAQIFTDSKGVAHRETYYDLPMNIVANACGGGGYTVRADGAKVDKDGYILVAANYGNYPRCSVVETSMGPGKVYDTGGFAARHPHGFDLATDWTNGDGR